MRKSTFEEEIAHNGFLLYRNVGDSMLPLIRQCFGMDRSYRSQISVTGCMCICGAICSICAQWCCGAVTCLEE